MQENVKKIIGYRARCFQKVVYKADEFIGSKTADTTTNLSDNNIEKQELIEEIFIPPEKGEEILNALRKVL